VKLFFALRVNAIPMIKGREKNYVENRKEKKRQHVFVNKTTTLDAKNEERTATCITVV
jgi:hypothetical protein